jgi:hypothetical protein
LYKNTNPGAISSTARAVRYCKGGAQLLGRCATAKAVRYCKGGAKKQGPFALVLQVKAAVALALELPLVFELRFCMVTVATTTGHFFFILILNYKK